MTRVKESDDPHQQNLRDEVSFDHNSDFCTLEYQQPNKCCPSLEK